MLLAVLLAGTHALAQETVFRSVDADGNVTFSATPPPPGAARQVEEVQILPGPTPEAQEAADQRVRALVEETERRRQARAEAQAPDEERAAAERELQQALADLEEARVQRDDDWQQIANGGRFLAPRYFERVEQAEQRVEEARRALQALR
jgi:hypothetical protein